MRGQKHAAVSNVRGFVSPDPLIGDDKESKEKLLKDFKSNGSSEFGWIERQDSTIHEEKGFNHIKIRHMIFFFFKKSFFFILLFYYFIVFVYDFYDFFFFMIFPFFAFFFFFTFQPHIVVKHYWEQRKIINWIQSL